MNIWIVNHYYIPPIQPGGTRHHSIAKQLQKLGHQVTIFASNYSHFTHKVIANDYITTREMQPYDDVFVVWLKTRDYQGNGAKRLLGMLDFSKQFKRAAKLIKIQQGVPDLIIGSNPHLFAAFAAMKVANKLKTKFIYEIRDVWPESLIDIGSISKNHPLMLYMARMHKQIIKKCDYVLAVLPEIKSYLVENYHYDEDNVIYFPNFVDTSLVDFEQLPFKSKQQRFKFIYAGSHGPANGLGVVIEAAELLQQQQINHIEIELIGDGPEKNKLIDLARKKSLTNIVFNDPVPKSEIHQYINQADFGLMLLTGSDVFRWGISPNKLFDYMLLQKPVVFAVNSSNNPIKNANAGITIAPDSGYELAQAMISLTRIPAEARVKMGLRAKKYVESHHDLSTLAKNLMKKIS